jgi:hypothetical protein
MYKIRPGPWEAGFSRKIPEPKKRLYRRRKRVVPDWSYEIHNETIRVTTALETVCIGDNGYNDPYAWYKFAVSEEALFMFFTKSPGGEMSRSYLFQITRYLIRVGFFIMTKPERWTKKKLDYFRPVLTQDTQHRDSHPVNFNRRLSGRRLEEGFFRRLRTENSEKQRSMNTRSLSCSCSIDPSKLILASSGVHTCVYLIGSCHACKRRTTYGIVAICQPYYPYDAVGYPA